LYQGSLINLAADWPKPLKAEESRFTTGFMTTTPKISLASSN